MLSADKRLLALELERSRRRAECFEGPLPSHEQFLTARGYDAALTEQIAAAKKELAGEDEDEDES